MTFDDAKIIEQLKKDFVDEISFYLEQCEESFLRLEQPEFQEEELGKIFRLAHSIKGSGSALGYTDFAAFAHLMEDCLSLLRDNPKLIGSEIISLLLKSTDALKDKIEYIRMDDQQPWMVEKLSEELRQATHKIESSQLSMPPTPLPVVVAAPAPANKDLPAQKQAPELDIDDPRFAPNPTSNLSAALANPVAPIQESTQEKAIWKDLADETQKQISDTDSQFQKSKEPLNRDAANPGQSAGIAAVKIDTERIDSILNIVGELVVIKSQLMVQTEQYLTDLKLNAIVSLMDKTIRDLQDRTLTMRMTPLKSLFLKLQRTVRDLSIKLNKPVEFKVSGEDTEIDRNMVELLSDPLLHICRNSLDHGIESAQERRTKGKTEKGLIHLSAKQVGGRVVIEVKDDGAGLNFERIIEKAKAMGSLTAAQGVHTMSEKEITNIIFEPGFSTADKVTDVSGRGVGMDIVRANIERLRGSIDITTQQSVGTQMTISLPLTTSITDGMLVEIGKRSFIIPMNTIHELINAGQACAIQLHVGQKVLNHRGKFLPILDLRELLLRQALEVPELGVGIPQETYQAREDDVVVIVETGTRFIALRLEKILGQVQVVLKSLGSNFDTAHGISGATILGDGKVALVLDPIGLADYAVAEELGKVKEKEKIQGKTKVRNLDKKGTMRVA